MLDKYAEELREAREQKGISLQQMAAKTRIDIKFLEAIDDGNFSFLPELYVKAFLKQYAKVVDLNEKEILERYEDAKAGRLLSREEKSLLEQKVEIEKEDESEKEAAGDTAKEVEKKPEQHAFKTFSDVSSEKPANNSGRQNKTLLTAFLSAAGAGAVILVIYFLFFSDSSDIVIDEKPYEQVLRETKERFQVEEQEPRQIVEQIADSLFVQISNIDSSDSVWVLVIYDDESKEDFLLYPGRSKSVKAANNFKLTLGNSGVVDLKLNNTSLNFEGRRRSVRHFKIDSSGIERLFSPPILKIE
jgi:transcriptional regulator with XRE-family HTH domain